MISQMKRKNVGSEITMVFMANKAHLAEGGAAVERGVQTRLFTARKDRLLGE